MGFFDNLKNDLAMGFGFKEKDDDYKQRTADTMAVQKAISSGDSSNLRDDLQSRYQREKMMQDMMRDDGSSSNAVTPAAEDVQSPQEQSQANQAMLNRMRMQQQQAMRGRNMDMARMMFERQNMMYPQYMPRQMQGLGGFRPIPIGMNQRFMPQQYGNRMNQQMMLSRMMRQQPPRQGGQAQQVPQREFGVLQQRQRQPDEGLRQLGGGLIPGAERPPEEGTPGLGGQGVMDQQATAENIEAFRMPPEMGTGFGGQGVQPAVRPPEEGTPGLGGQGVQPNQGGSAARARELMLSGDVAGAMRMLKSNVGMEDTSLNSADALKYMQTTGDQSGAEQILKSSVGLPTQQQQQQQAMSRNRVAFRPDPSLPNGGLPRDTRQPVGNMRGIRMPAAPGKGGRGVMPQPGFPPRYPQPMPYNRPTSPAFNYASQNYGRLGGMQRTMPRPMEMMSQRERQQIGRIADSFGPRPPRPTPGMGGGKGGGKGGGRTGSQARPPVIPGGIASFIRGGLFR